MRRRAQSVAGMPSSSRSAIRAEPSAGIALIVAAQLASSCKPCADGEPGSAA